MADNVEVRNAKKIIKVQTKIKFNLLYDRSASLVKKIKLEQLRKETNKSGASHGLEPRTY